MRGGAACDAVKTGSVALGAGACGSGAFASNAATGATGRDSDGGRRSASANWGGSTGAECVVGAGRGTGGASLRAAGAVCGAGLLAVSDCVDNRARSSAIVALSSSDRPSSDAMRSRSELRATNTAMSTSHSSMIGQSPRRGVGRHRAAGAPAAMTGRVGMRHLSRAWITPKFQMGFINFNLYTVWARRAAGSTRIPLGLAPHTESIGAQHQRISSSFDATSIGESWRSGIRENRAVFRVSSVSSS